MELREWLARLSAVQETTDVDLDADAVRLLLALARDAAQQVERLAAPLTTFLVGVAVGRGTDLEIAAAQATAALTGTEAVTDDDLPDDN